MGKKYSQLPREKSIWNGLEIDFLLLRGYGMKYFTVSLEKNERIE